MMFECGGIDLLYASDNERNWTVAAARRWSVLVTSRNGFVEALLWDGSTMEAFDRDLIAFKLSLTDWQSA